MKILHYSLGFPPYRSGGLTKFCVDLAGHQVREDDDVALLWPGKMYLVGKRIRIQKHRSIDGIENYEVVNPVPVPFDEGIRDFDLFMRQGDPEPYRQLLNDLAPDVLHVHTLMGLHRVLLEVAKEKGVRMVFTTHDFFPICPKVTMFRQGRSCESIETCVACGVCNATALSVRKIQILQSPLYRRLKNSPVVKRLRKCHRDEYLGGSADMSAITPVGTADDYRKLRLYYQEMLSLMDVIHYNSTVTRDVYERFFELPKSRVLPITHADISDQRREKTFSGNPLRIRFLGPQGGAKGFFLLKEALDELWKLRQDFCLDVHFVPVDSSPYIRIHERYEYAELGNIFNETDVLVVPSLWHETFGFTVLEALSYGVPVVISGTVGAKDILAEGVGVVIEEITPEKLVEAIDALTTERLREMNRAIIKRQPILTMAAMSEAIQGECYLGE